MNRTERAKEELKKIAELFGSRKLPEACAKAYINSPEKPSSAWSLSNQVIMLMHGTEDARGFRQWKEAGRSIKGGSSAFHILGPVMVDKKEVDRETGEEKEEKRLIGFKTISVFRFEDTIGKKLPVYEPKELPPLLDVARKWGVDVKYERQRGAYGSFSPSKNTIKLGTEDWDVFFHELAHKAHSRLEKLKGGQDPEQEAIAQLAAATLARLYGKNADNFSWHYIAHYAGDKNPQTVGRLCMKVLNKTQQILETILSENN